jgi:hypothetical protein
MKCAKKGIDCSGPGRIRFADGVARRGRLKGCKIPRVEGETGCNDLPNPTEFQALRWPDDQRAKNRRRIDPDDVATENIHSVPPRDKRTQTPDNQKSMRTSLQMSVTCDENDGEVEDIRRDHDSLVALPASTIKLWIAPIDQKVRMLFSYCKSILSLNTPYYTNHLLVSETIAPAMVVLDDSSNGYRSLVLPMALEDDLLRRAVGVVAAQHLSHQRPELRDAAEAGRLGVISRLRRDSLKQSADKVFNKFTWATLIVLLVGETVTGSEDFCFFVQMLLCLSDNKPRRDSDPTLIAFLEAQTHM